MMIPSEWRAFLLFGKRTAKVATVRPDGRPHFAPVWFVLDSDKLVFMTGKDTVKGKNMLRDPRVMLSIDDERPPFAFRQLPLASFQRSQSPAKANISCPRNK
jgi:PPOX class probable F420-dependent enzyme